MAHWLKVLAALGENLSSVPITPYWAAYEYLQLQPWGISSDLSTCTYPYTQTKIFQNAYKETSGGATYIHFLDWYFIDVCVPNLTKSYTSFFFFFRVTTLL